MDFPQGEIARRPFQSLQLFLSVNVVLASLYTCSIDPSINSSSNVGANGCEYTF